MNSSLYSIRGTRLYVEQYNEEAEEVLLYLHGGPGASCIDFCFYQAKELSRALRVIAIDQRGVLRSDPIYENEQFGIDDIIQDLEELRIQLGISKWNLLGHSFGGILAVKYAVEYPNVIKKIIFETPCFDTQSSTRSIISKARQHFIEHVHSDGTRECDKYLNGDFNPNEMWNAMGRIFQLLGEDKDLLYFKGLTPDEYNKIFQSQEHSEDLWSKNEIHHSKLQEEGKLFENLIPVLSLLSCPTLLMAGAFDPVCCTVQQHAYLQQVEDSRIIVFEKSAHFPRLEEPEKYTKEVLSFILD